MDKYQLVQHFFGNTESSGLVWIRNIWFAFLYLWPDSVYTSSMFIPDASTTHSSVALLLKCCWAVAYSCVKTNCLSMLTTLLADIPSREVILSHVHVYLHIWYLTCSVCGGGVGEVGSGGVFAKTEGTKCSKCFFKVDIFVLLNGVKRSCRK